MGGKVQGVEAEALYQVVPPSSPVRKTTIAFSSLSYSLPRVISGKRAEHAMEEARADLMVWIQIELEMVQRTLLAKRTRASFCPSAKSGVL